MAQRHKHQNGLFALWAKRCGVLGSIALLLLLVMADCSVGYAQTGGDCKKLKKPLLIIGQDKDTMLTYMHDTKSKPSGFMAYTSLKKLEGLAEPADYGSGIQHAQFFTKKYPGSILQIGLYLVGDLRRINDGLLDVKITRLAHWCKQVKNKILLRIGYEFDYPANNYAPKEYARAFRRIVDGLRAEGVDNVYFVWHSAGVAKKPEQWYPGNEYVDWCAVSFFDASNIANMQIVQAFSQQHGKPFMIAEATPRGFSVTGGENSWNSWFVPFFNFIKEANVQIISYINSDWEKLPMFKNQGWPNARIQDNEYIKIRWFEELEKIGVR